jgi:hypothetical protein
VSVLLLKGNSETPKDQEFRIKRGDIYRFIGFSKTRERSGSLLSQGRTIALAGRSMQGIPLGSGHRFLVGVAMATPTPARLP